MAYSHSSPLSESGRPSLHAAHHATDHQPSSSSIPLTSDIDHEKPIWIYIDMSSLWIGSKQLAARESHFVPNLKLEEDPRVRVHIQNSIEVIAHGRTVAEGSLLFNTPRFWQFQTPNWFPKECGWKIEADESAAISEITKRTNNTSLEIRSTIVIVSGDLRILPSIESALQEDGWRVEIYCWKHQALSIALKVVDNLLVSTLDEYFARITFIQWNQKSKQSISHNGKQVIIHMRPDPYRDHNKWCIELEKAIRWPFQYCYQLGETAETDDLVLLFYNSNNGESFDVDNFLQNINQNPSEGMTCAELYDKDDEDSDNDTVKEDSDNDTVRVDSDNDEHSAADDERCQYKFCCQYGIDCYKMHTVEEHEFFERNGGVGLLREKVKLCWNYHQNRCTKEAKDCTLAHGEEDALCPNCKETGHFEYKCPKR